MRPILKEKKQKKSRKHTEEAFRNTLLTKHMKDADPLYYLEQCLKVDDIQFMLRQEDISLLFNNIRDG